MARHQTSALYVARWLEQRDEIIRVLFPALESNPGHQLWLTQFSGAAGPFTVELRACSEQQFTCFISKLKLFALGTSWGGFESLIMPAVSHHLRHLATLPDEGRLVRLHIGLEDARDLCDDLEQAFQALYER